MANTRKEMIRLGLIHAGRKRGYRVSPKTIEKNRAARMKQKIPTSFTEPENRFHEICKNHSLPFKYTGDGSFWVGGVNPDFVDINGKKIALYCPHCGIELSEGMIEWRET